MPAITATAPGKIILFGEHAVVYGRPAIAVPVQQVRARAVVMAEPRAEPGNVHLQAPQIGLDAYLVDMAADQPLAAAVRLVLAALEIDRPPAMTVRISSTIPIAGGLGSGAAVTIAVIRALTAFLGYPLPVEQVSALAYEVEKLHHGTPSGIDNTVIAYAMPVFFIREKPIQTFHVAAPFTLVIGDTGVASPTGLAVAELRRSWQADPGRYEPWFDAAGQIAVQARQLIEEGQPARLGLLMDENQRLLQAMGVSSAVLDRLVAVARRAGADGAKLSGGGRGGNMIALVKAEAASEVAASLRKAGAVRTLITEVASQAAPGAGRRG